MHGGPEVRPDLNGDNYSLFRILEKINVKLNNLLAAVAGIAMLLMTLLIVANVLIRIKFNPIPGINEMVGWLSAVTVAFSLGYTQLQRGHVDIEVLLDKFPPRVRNKIRGLMLFISMFIFAFVSYRLVLYGNTVMRNGTLSETLAVIFYPFIYLLAFGFFGLTFALLVDSISFFRKGGQS